MYNNKELTDEKRQRWSGYYHWEKVYKTEPGWNEECFYYEKEATNPPKAWEWRDSILRMPIHCDDDIYPVPCSNLSEGVIREQQQRTLYGIEYAP